MKQSRLLRPMSATQSALGIILGGLVLVACSGSVFGGGSGDASVGGAVGAGGHPSGGAAGAGAGQGVGGSAGAPSSTGGAPSTCTGASDCTVCAYYKAPQDSSQCYCAICANTPMSTSQCDANHSAWQSNCANVPLPCPALACVLPPPAACVNGLCALSSSGTTN